MKLVAAAVLMTFAVCVSAQTIQSHVERFSTPEARAQRIEQETTLKLTSTPNIPELLNDRALARLRLQKFDLAVVDLSRAIQLVPGNAEFRANLGYALWKTGKFAEAIEAERQALKLDSKNYTANYQLGRFLLRSGDKALIPDAIARFRNAIEVDGRQYEVRFELIAAYREIGDTASALGQLDVLQDARPSDARVSYVAGLLFIDRSEFKSAESSLREALKLDPNLYGAWQDLGLLFARQNRWTEAADAFRELVRRQQNSVEAAYFLALSYYNANRPADAEIEARRALRLEPGFSDAHTLLGIILAARGSANAEAIDSLSQAVALSPGNVDAHLYLGRLLYLQRDYVAALGNLRTAVKLGPKKIESRFYLGTVLESVGESEAALIEYREIVNLDPKSFFGLVGLGALQVKQGKIDEAIVSLRQAVSAEPASFEANWALGRALLLKESFAAAADVLKTAVSLQPNRTDARYQYAISLRRLGRNEEAKIEFDLVEKLNREFREVKNQ
jgi:tetratricopeptide (TPR) repeat protein